MYRFICIYIYMYINTQIFRYAYICMYAKVKEEVAVPNYDNETEEETYKRTKLAEIAEKQALEVFVSRNTGKYECQSCGYIYSEAIGNEKYNIKAGTPFLDIEKFRCPQVSAKNKYIHLYICIYIHMYMFLYTYFYICMFTNKYAYIHVYIYIYEHICIFRHVYIYVYKINIYSHI
jgi:rubredoxin